MENINSDIFQEFYVITRKDSRGYFIRVTDFLQNEATQIQKYYEGKLKKVSPNAFRAFDSLQKETVEMLSYFTQFKKQFTNIKWWDFLGQIETIDSQLNTIKNINKWSRSTESKFGYKAEPQVNYILRQNETLERISQDVMGSNNPQDDWARIALDNDLIEEDYTPEGGNDLLLTMKNSSIGNLKLSSIVDVISGKSVYGKDLARKLSIQDDDLVALDYDSTLIQSVEILSTLKKNDNPDFPNDGIQSNLVIGTSRALWNFPVITRQLAASFKTDDSLKNFSMKNLRQEGDVLIAKFKIETKLNESIELDSSLT